MSTLQVLITGSNGFIAKNLVEHLSTPKDLPRFEELLDKSVKHDSL